MRSRSALVKLSFTLSFLAGAACSENMNDPLNSGMTADAGFADSCTQTEPCALSLGVPASEVIFPAGDTDSYTFNVANAGQVITVSVRNDVTISPVVLEVVLFGPEGTALENRRGNPREIQNIEIQQIATAPGVHRVVVRDVANDDGDRFNPYLVEVNLLSQTDDNEPNDATGPDDPPTVLTPGAPTTGVIGSQGDEDWFEIDVGQNQLIEIRMQAIGESPVNLTWTLYEPTGITPLASSVEPAGAQAWPVEIRAVGNAAGAYLIVVRDDDGQQADLGRVYQLEVGLLNEPDLQDLTAVNETREQATMLESGRTVTAFIAATADLDWYAIEVTGADIDSPRLLTVEARMADPSPVDLSFLVLEPDGTTEICDGRDGDLCKALRVEPQDSQEVLLRTAHPVFVDGTYYVLVRDFQDDTADPVVSYSLTAAVEDDPDPNETFLLNGRDGAVPVATTTPTTALTIGFEWVEGYISHANDQDWYRFDIPDGRDEYAPQHNGDWLVQLELQIVAPTPVELEAFFFGPSPSSRRSYGGYGKRCRRPDNPADPEPCQFPDAENGIDESFGEANGDCFVVFREVTRSGPHYFRMTDLDRDDFDLGTRYRFRVTISAGCPDNSVCIGRFDGPNGDLCGR